jgi:hypothetical protein
MLALNSYAQDDFKNEEAMVKEADELFNNEEYIKAFEYYQTLLSNHRDNAIYSYRFGVCMMFSDKRDKEKPIKYLEKASLDPTMDIKVFYFLGKAYHQNYRFTEAKTAYQKYKDLAKAKVVSKYDIDRRIQECDNGLALLSNIHLLFVINKVEVKETTFYRTYNMAKSGGIIIMKPEALKTKYDKKHNTDRTAFYIPENRILYFSSYGMKGVNGKDIYRAHQLADGSWSEPEVLGATINTKYDEAFPYITPNGEELYFSSKGHNSMGGYDIFKSKFNTGSFNWGKPENMNFPINTPFDDLFYVPDTLGKFANFSSTRSSVDGLVYVYKIGTDHQQEQQDFAKVLKEGGDVTATISLIKEVAELKTNINVDEYIEKIANISDTANLAQNDGPNDNPNANANVAQQTTVSGISSEEAVDSTFAVYRDIQYRLVGLKKQKASIKKIYHQNKVQADNIVAQQGASGVKEAAKYRKAADVANDILGEINHEIAISEKASNQIMDIASNMQYYQGRGMDDSVIVNYERVNRINAQLDINDDIAKSIVDAQFEAVKSKREMASSFYKRSTDLEKEIANLKSERDEYAAEAERLTNPEEKAEYIELIDGMNTDIANKEAAYQHYTDQWKSTRHEADSMSEQMAFVETEMDTYEQETANISFGNQNYISEADAQKVDAEIAQVQGTETNAVIAVNNIESQNNQNEASNSGNTGVNGGVAAIGVTAGVNAAANNSNQNSAQENPKTNYLDNPASVAMIESYDKSVVQLADEKYQLDQKEIIARNLGADKYTEYQKLSNKIESDYSELKLNNNLSTEQQIAKLNQLKKEMTQANELSREAAAAFNMANIYKKKSLETSQLIAEANTKKIRVEALLNEDKIDEAQRITNEVANYRQDISEEVIKRETTEQIAKLNKEENNYSNSQDSLKALIAQLEQSRNNAIDGGEAQAKIDASIQSKKAELEQLAINISQRQAQKTILQQSTVVEQKVIAIASKGGTQIASAEAKSVPKDIMNSDNLMAIYTAQDLLDQEKAIDESIATVLTKKQNSLNTNNIVANTDALTIPVYPTSAQNEVAAEVLEPRVNVVKALDKESSLVDNKMVVSLEMAKAYNEQAKQKMVELEKAYAAIDQSKPLNQQTNKVEHAKNLEKELLEINKNQEAIVQYVNIIKKEQIEISKQENILIDEISKSKEYIANNELDKAKGVENQTIGLVQMYGSGNDYLKSHLKTYDLENEGISKKIAKLDADISATKAEKTNNGLSDTELAIIRTKENKLKRQKDSLIAIQKQNTAIVNMVIDHSQKMENTDFSTVDSAKIARANMVPIVSVNSEIFNPDYLAKHSLIENIEEQQPDEAIAETDIEPVNELSNNDGAYIKKYIIQQQLKTIDKEIVVLSNKRSKSNNLNEKEAITMQIKDLHTQKINLNDELDRAEMIIDKVEAEGYEVVYSEQDMNLDQAIQGLKTLEDSLNKTVAELRQEAKSLRGKSKQAKLNEANEKDEIAMELSLTLTEIIAMRNEAKYHENKLLLAEFSDDQLADPRMQSASTLITFADQNMEAAHARREMVNSGDYSEEEQIDLLAEAEKYEMQALTNQSDALAAYENAGIIAANASPKPERTAEEIPNDDVDASNNQNNIAQNNNVNLNTNGGIAFIPLFTDRDIDTAATAEAQNSISQINNNQNQIAQNEGGNTNVNANTGGVAVIPVVTGGNDDNNTIDTNTVAETQNDAAQNNDEVNQVAQNDELNTNNTTAITNNSVTTADQNATNQPQDIQVEPTNTKVSNNNLGINYNAPITGAEGTKPISDNSELLPSGLVYKVQVAAFRNPVPMSTFKGITPMAGERSPNSAFIRYLAGIFPNYSQAAASRDIIRTKGFSDAFVVVYFKGKRISIAEARRLIANGQAYTSDELAQFAIQSNTEYYTLNKAIDDQLAQNETVDGVKPINANSNETVQNIDTKNYGIRYDVTIPENTEVPLNSKMNPIGLVFKVQLDVLKQKVPANSFKGISPVAVEQMNNSYYYVAGAFPNYVDAASARDVIQTKGYPGAFIVVYFNGKRISTEDANQLIASEKAFTEPGLIQYAKENNSDYYTSNDTESQTITTPDVSDSNLPKVTLYYSVQIGVFGGPRTASRLYNLQDLYFDRTTSGYYRYFSGKYDNEGAAKSSRDRIRTIGIRDAFVVAFRDGQRISLSEARKLESDGRNKLIAISRNGASPAAAASSQAQANNNTTQTQQTPNVQSAKSAEGIVFRVQLGAYKGTRNSAQLQVINSMSENGISSYTTANGLTIYFTNGYASYQEARAARARIVAAGHTDVFVVALQNGQKISVRTALDLLGQ